jgi:hypothetical protein
MAFTFEKYGTFTGPGTPFEYRDNDDFDVSSYDGSSFNLNDVSVCLVNRSESPADYIYMHLNGFRTSTLTLERSSGNIPSFFVNVNRSTFSGEVFSNGGAHRLSAKKNFDIPHPNKQGWRLRHTCIEGPENAVYYRGRLAGSNIIELPEYWKGFIDPESISVHLTQIGSQQDLIVEKIEWGTKIIIKSGSSSSIDCYYIVYANRIDGENLIVEYEGNSPADYPGNNDEYSIVGWNYDVRS